MPLVARKGIMQHDNASSAHGPTFDDGRRRREAGPFPLDPSIDPMISSRWLWAVPYVKALRPHQWSKNLLVLLPVVAAHNLTPKVWIAVLLAFVSFSFVASSA